MGGVPLYALERGRPSPAAQPWELLTEILAGGAEKAQEAAARSSGVTAWTMPNRKYGLAVTGLCIRAHPHQAERSPRRAPPHKALGTGIAVTAIKKEKGIAGIGCAPAVEQMKDAEPRRRRDLAKAYRSVHALTDVTGVRAARPPRPMMRREAERRAFSSVGVAADPAQVPSLPPWALSPPEAAEPRVRRPPHRFPDGYSEVIAWYLADAQRTAGSSPRSRHGRPRSSCAHSRIGIAAARIGRWAKESPESTSR